MTLKRNIPFAALFLSHFLFSQQFQITGKIINEKNSSVGSAEILLLATDSVAVKSELSDSNGLFSFQANHGSYILQIKYLKNIIYSKNVSLQNNIDLGNIKTEKPKEIQGIVLEGKKKLIERKVDRLVFNVENSIAAAGGDAWDALRATPGVRVQSDQITMIGKNTLSVMVDDRLIQLSGNDLASFLRTIKSDDIKSIEVITNPPAKYDAEGNSGIVNIIMKKAKKNSISGNIRSSYTQAVYTLGSLGGGLNYQKNKVTLTSSLSYENGSTAPYQEYTLHYPNYIWFEKNAARNFRNSISGRIALDYKVSSKTTVGMQYSGAYSTPVSKGDNASFIRQPGSVLDSLIITPSRLEEKRRNHSLNFHSITKLDTLGRQFSIDADYFSYNSDLNNRFSTDTFFPNGYAVPGRFIAANNLSDQNIDIYSAKADYEMPLKWANLSFGAKASFINNNSGISYFDTSGLQPIFDPSKSNLFTYKENTQAVYFSGNKSLSKKWDLQAGLRIENTQTKGYSATLDQTNKNNYIKLFPTFYLTYKADENSVWGLNYNRRIDRPGYSKLNPFRTYTSAFNYSEGNPFLQPFFTHNVEFSFNYKNSYFALYSNYMTNKFDEITFVDAQSNIQHVFPLNFYKKQNYGLLWYYTFNKLSWWESEVHTNVYYSKTTSKIENTVPDIDNWTFSFNANNSFVLNKKKTLRAEFNFNYQSPSTAGSYDLSSFYYFDAGIRYSVLNKKLMIALNLMDIFKTNKQTFTQYVNGIRQENFDYKDTQKFRLSLTWSFGKILNLNQREKSNEEEKSRL